MASKYEGVYQSTYLPTYLVLFVMLDTFHKVHSNVRHSDENILFMYLPTYMQIYQGFLRIRRYRDKGISWVGGVCFFCLQIIEFGVGLDLGYGCAGG